MQGEQILIILCRVVIIKKGENVGPRNLNDELTLMFWWLQHNAYRSTVSTHTKLEDEQEMKQYIDRVSKIKYDVNQCIFHFILECVEPWSHTQHIYTPNLRKINQTMITTYLKVCYWLTPTLPGVKPLGLTKICSIKSLYTSSSWLNL
jgi:hypothetical protein